MRYKKRQKNGWRAVLVLVPLAFLLGMLLMAAAAKAGEKEYSVLTAIGCGAVAYEQKEEAGYLTLDWNGKELTVRVEDKNLQDRLSEEALESVAGVNLELSIPKKVLKERHVDPEQGNLFTYLYSGTYDGYLVLQDVFFNRDFSGRNTKK